jgi:hypothetical protein
LTKKVRFWVYHYWGLVCDLSRRDKKSNSERIIVIIEAIYSNNAIMLSDTHVCTRVEAKSKEL